jgi:CubicO group peptidase (beta-lactamase class C family)
MAALDALDDWPVPAAAAAVISPAGVRATHGDTERVFELASVTKPLVARAAQVAIEEGVVELDTPAGPPGSTVRHRVLAKPGTRRIYSNYGSPCWPKPSNANRASNSAVTWPRRCASR